MQNGAHSELCQHTHYPLVAIVRLWMSPLSKISFQNQILQTRSYFWKKII